MMGQPMKYQISTLLGIEKKDLKNRALGCWLNERLKQAENGHTPKNKTLKVYTYANMNHFFIARKTGRASARHLHR